MHVLLLLLILFTKKTNGYFEGFCRKRTKIIIFFRLHILVSKEKKKSKKNHPQMESETSTNFKCYSLVILITVAYRLVIATYPHSGQSKPPIYGDYEAQRHWMEITWNLNVHDWYRNTSDNDLLYWGLDYPPLTAYHSQLMGHV